MGDASQNLFRSRITNHASLFIFTFHSFVEASHRPFHALPNVLMTPHVSGWTEGMMDARAGVIAENIHRAARGEAPLNHIR